MQGLWSVFGELSDGNLGRNSDNIPYYINVLNGFWVLEITDCTDGFEDLGEGSWFLSTDDARARINNWRIGYTETRPHSSLGNLTPSDFAAQLKETRKVA
ncbi:integrase core domain-containing protein [Aestuariicoccus sp. MJ-SS9]|uniref:integrase core domain-containing protein n=1 Tax=Aestuariicoccus sp. MJ-SS9 TaxID=3079855 RepID=UPI0029086146|nr:integrase core domain-containing protein [Aestuariicoccus sp. MJ-SS9]MDU8913860.1 integrase core domain-containing protein [Aestuariicoccus sp. MJ-SS9]